MRLTNVQLYMLKRLAHGVTMAELTKWDQRPLRGLFFRELFEFCWVGEVKGARVTELGWAAYQSTLVPKLRQNPYAPIFAHKQKRSQRAG